MATRFTNQNCKVETTYSSNSDGRTTEHITLSVDPASALTLAIDERSRFVLQTPTLPRRGSSRVRSTKYGFELIPERQ